MGKRIEPRPDHPVLFSEKPNIKVGRYTYGSPSLLTWTDKDVITIGSFCSIAGGVAIFGGSEHRMDWVTTYPIRVAFGLPGAFEDGVPCSKGDTVVGNDVWIGYGALVLSGVHIGDGAVIGAGAVVTKDVAPYAIMAGNPARLLRHRFDEPTRQALLEIKWWDWPIEKVIDNVELLCSKDAGGVNTLIELFRAGRL